MRILSTIALKAVRVAMGSIVVPPACASQFSASVSSRVTCRARTSAPPQFLRRCRMTGFDQEQPFANPSSRDDFRVAYAPRSRVAPTLTFTAVGTTRLSIAPVLQRSLALHLMPSSTATPHKRWVYQAPRSFCFYEVWAAGALARNSACRRLLQERAIRAARNIRPTGRRCDDGGQQPRWRPGRPASWRRSRVQEQPRW